MSIDIEDFHKLDLRVGRIILAEKIPESDKLLKLVFDFGNEKRQIMSGIAEFFEDPSVLVGKEIPVLMNIKKCKLRGYESEGMIIMADVSGRPVLLCPETEVPPGSIVK